MVPVLYGTGITLWSTGIILCLTTSIFELHGHISDLQGSRLKLQRSLSARPASSTDYWNTVSSPSEVQCTRRKTGSFLAIPLTNATSSECFRDIYKMPQIPVINDTGTKTVESPGILLWAMGAALWATDVILWATEIIFWANGIIF